MPNSKKSTQRADHLVHGLAGLKQLSGAGHSKAPAIAPQKVSRKRQKMLPPGSGLSAGNRSARTAAGAPAPGTERRPEPGRVAVAPAQAHSLAAEAVNADDLALFRRAVAFVAPLPDTRRAVLPPVTSSPPDVLRQRREKASGRPEKNLAPVSDAYTPAHVHHDDTAYVRNPHSIELLKQLERGRWVPQATLDLHGSNVDQARERLERFLTSCVEHRLRCVRVVHGKGYGSKNGEPVLKTTLRRWLTQWQAVQAYAQCAEEHGGAGAVDVLLELAEGTASAS